MISVEDIAKDFGCLDSMTEKAGSVWLTPMALDVREMAARMIAQEARLVTIAAQQPGDDKSIRLDYHWDLNGKLLTVVTTTTNGQVASICDICKAADWIEREIHEYFAIDVTGREYVPLVLRSGDTPGVNLREEDE